MAKLDNINRIIAEDFEKDDQELIGRLGGVLNHFMEQTFEAFAGRIDFDNLDQEVKTIQITVDGSGTPVGESQFSSEKLSRAKGSVVIAARNLDNIANFPTSVPFVVFSSVQDSLYKINNISGLQANEKYELVLILFPA